MSRTFKRGELIRDTLAFISLAAMSGESFTTRGLAAAIGRDSPSGSLNLLIAALRDANVIHRFGARNKCYLYRARRVISVQEYRQLFKGTRGYSGFRVRPKTHAPVKHEHQKRCAASPAIPPPIPETAALAVSSGFEPSRQLSFEAVAAAIDDSIRPKPEGIDVEELSVREARQLFDQLKGLFG